MNEKQILLQISRITNRSKEFSTALEQVGCLIDRTLSGRGLAVGQIQGSWNVADTIAMRTEQFFEGSHSWPCRSVYTVALRSSGRELGKLVVFFAAADADDDLRRRVSTFAGEQLGALLARLQLARQRRRLRAEICRIRINLATRKSLQRAEAILARRGLNGSNARVWIQREALNKRISTIEMANLVFDRESTRVEEPVSMPIGLAAWPE